MTARTWVIPPVNPATKAAMLDRNRANGWRTVPGTLDQEMGWHFDPTDATEPLWVPPHDGPPHRTVAAPAHWARLWTALAAWAAICAILGLAAGLYTRLRWGT